MSNKPANNARTFIGRGIVDINRFGNIEVNGKNITEYMASKLGLGEGDYNVVFPDEVIITINKYPEEEIHEEGDEDNE